MTISVCVAGEHERAAVESFYRAELERDVPLERGEEVIAAWRDTVVVGALRLCPEAGTLVLRTVVVAKDRRGQGIGRAILHQAGRAIGARECWCFPWSYLERFYAEIGLLRVPDEAVPSSLRHRHDAGCIPMYRVPRRSR